MTAPKFEMVDELPPIKPKRDHHPFAKAAHENPTKWIILPWKDDNSGSLVALYKKYHHCECRTVARRVYIRALQA